MTQRKENELSCEFGDVSSNCYYLLDQGVTEKLIYWGAKKFLPSFQRFPDIDLDDLKSEIREKLIKTPSTFEETEKSKPRSYICKIIQNTLISYLREKNSDSRYPAAGLIYPEKRMYEDEDFTVDWLALIPKHIAADMSQPEKPDALAEKKELIDAMRRTCDYLTQRQNQIIEGLKVGKSPTEISIEIGISRETYYQELRAIRQIFIKHGMLDFLH
jgi:RNA polymerase sigma factor (sigma-70 family)